MTTTTENTANNPATSIDPAADAVVLFDGECGLCHGSVKWLIKRDRMRALRYAPLQGETARAILERHGKDPAEMAGMWLVEHPDTDNEKLLHKSDAALRSLHYLGGIWELLSLLAIIPRGLRDYVYGIIAKNRYKWFGKKNDACELGTPEQRHMMLP